MGYYNNNTMKTIGKVIANYLEEKHKIFLSEHECDKLFALGNVYKYLERYKEKGFPLSDICKAVNYLHYVNYGTWANSRNLENLREILNVTGEIYTVNITYNHLLLYLHYVCTTELWFDIKYIDTLEAKAEIKNTIYRR